MPDAFWSAVPLSSMPEPLTERQNEAYEFILAQVRDHRAVPTLREIGQALGIRSSNAVTKLVRALVAKGYLLHTPHACLLYTSPSPRD